MVSPYLPEKVFLIWDDLAGHGSEEVTNFLEDTNIESFILPHASHGLLNPCDNSINALIRHHFHLGDRATHPKMLKATRDAYNAIKDETVVKYFERAGIISNDDPAEVAERLAHEGYHPDNLKEQRVEHLKQAPREWEHGLRNIDDRSHHQSDG